MLCLLSLTGQYHLQILNVSLEDDGPYECQVGRSVSSRAIVSRTAWLNVQSKQTHLLPPRKEGCKRGKEARGTTLAMTDRSTRAANGCARTEKVTCGGKPKPVTIATFRVLMSHGVSLQCGGESLVLHFR